MGADDRNGFAGLTAGLLDGFGFRRLLGEALRGVETLAPPANRAARNEAACSAAAGKTGWP